MEVPSTTTVFTPPAVAKMPLVSWGGRRGRPRMIACSPRQQTVEALAAHLAPDAWQTQCVAAGTTTAQCYQTAVQRVWEDHTGERGPERWLVLRRNLDGGDVTAHLANVSETTAPETLERVSTMRPCIAADLKRQQVTTGMSEYEVRGWLGWHHHIALSLLAGAFLLHQQVARGEATLT